MMVQDVWGVSVHVECCCSLSALVALRGSWGRHRGCVWVVNLGGPECMMIL